MNIKSNIESIRDQIETLNYSQTKLIFVGPKKMRVTRTVFEYELGTRNRNMDNIYTQERIITKLEKMKEVEELKEYEDLQGGELF